MTPRKIRKLSTPREFQRSDVIRITKEQAENAAAILTLSKQQDIDTLTHELSVIAANASLLAYADENLDDKSQKNRIATIRDSARETLDLITRFPAYLRGPPPMINRAESYIDKHGQEISDAEIAARYLRRVSEDLSARLLAWKGQGAGNPGNWIEARVAANLTAVFQRWTGKPYPGTQKQGLRFVSHVLEAMYPALKGDPEKLRAILLRARKLPTQEFNPNSANS